jgi:hypothetical protein
MKRLLRDLRIEGYVDKNEFMRRMRELFNRYPSKV